MKISREAAEVSVEQFLQQKYCFENINVLHVDENFDMASAEPVDVKKMEAYVAKHMASYVDKLLKSEPVYFPLNVKKVPNEKKLTLFRGDKEKFTDTMMGFFCIEYAFHHGEIGMAVGARVKFINPDFEPGLIMKALAIHNTANLFDKIVMRA